ncbi:MAG TPA: RsmE family RNA methyltransferase [Saprospiraceae bacterium]|nr:RsmE family RNA methyltransferase [Saprospiraceae bacterium]
MDLFTGTRINDSQFILAGDEFHHCMRVTRHRTGDSILVTDFDGRIYQSVIQKPDADQLYLLIEKLFREEHSNAPKISIAISPTQQMDRFEWFVEKAVENGIHEIIPLWCKRTENTRLKTERLQKIITASAKQTLRPLKPELRDLCRLQDLFTLKAGVSQRFIGHCEDGLEGFLGSKYNPGEDVLVLIGPAGDFTLEEIEFALTHHCIPVSLGAYRLRTETAGLSALQILQTIRQLL